MSSLVSKNFLWAWKRYQKNEKVDFKHYHNLLKSEIFAKVVFNGETIDFTLLLLSTKSQFFCFSNNGVIKKWN